MEPMKIGLWMAVILHEMITCFVEEKRGEKIHCNGTEVMLWKMVALSILSSSTFAYY